MTIESSPFRGVVALKRYLPVMHVGMAAATDGQKVIGLSVLDVDVSGTADGPN